MGPKNRDRIDSTVVLVLRLLSQHKQDGAAVLCSSKLQVGHTATLLQVGPGGSSCGSTELEGVTRTGMAIQRTCIFMLELKPVLYLDGRDQVWDL